MGSRFGCHFSECGAKQDVQINTDRIQPLDIGPAKKPKHALLKPPPIATGRVFDDDPSKETESLSFILSDKSLSDITRMDYDREMVIGKWNNGSIGHSSIFICYFSEFKRRQKLIGRVFCIELFTKNDQTVLSIKGPLYNTRDYSCKQFYVIRSNMEQLIRIAKFTMNRHGKYHWLTNNCRHFTNNYLDNVQKECKGFTVGVSVQELNQYICKYVPTKADIKRSGGLVVDKEVYYQSIVPEESMDDSLCHSLEPSDNVGDSKPIRKEFAAAISFLEVINKYSI